MQLSTVGESLNAFNKIDKILVASSGLDEATEQIRVLKELKSATANYSTEALKMALSQEALYSGTNKLDKEMVKNILSQHILDKELLETTSAEIANAGATKVNEDAKKSATKATDKYKYAVQGLGNSFKTFATSTVGKLTIVGSVIAILGTAIYKWAKADEKALKSSKEKLNEISNEYENTLSEIESLESQVKSLDDQIKELDPITDANKIKDLETEKALIEQEVALLEEKNKLVAQEKAKAAEEALTKTSSSKYSYDNYSETSSNYTGDMAIDAGITLGHIISNKGVSDQVTEYEELLLAMEEVNKLEGQIQNLEKERAQAILDKDLGKTQEIEQQIDDLESQIQTVKTDASTLAGSVQSTWTELEDGTTLKNDVGEILFKYFEFSEAVDAATASFNALNTAQQKNILINKLVSQGFTKPMAEEIMGNISEDDYSKLFAVDWDDVILPNANDYGLDYETWGKDLAKAWLDGLTDGIENGTDDVSASMEELNKNVNTSYDSIQKSYDAVQEFKDAMSNGMTDSALDAVTGLSDELKALVAEFYAGTISADELFQALTNHYENDLKNYSEAIIAKNKNNVEFCNNVGLNSAEVTNKFLEDYGIDLSNHRTYASKKLKIEQETLQKISSAWSKYYNTQTMTLTGQGLELQEKILNGTASKGEKALYNSIMKPVADYKNAIADLNEIAYSGIESDFSGISSSMSSSGSSSSSAKQTKKEFDNIETALSNMSDTLSDLDSKVADTYSTWTERNNKLAESINKTQEAINLQNQAYNTYMNLANSVGLADPYKKLVQNGAMNISVITDENLADQITEYQQW